MIRILTKQYGEAVSLLCKKLDLETAEYDTYISLDSQKLAEFLSLSVNLDCLFLVGNTWKWCEVLAQTFELALSYDHFAEKKIIEYCKLSNAAVPAQYILDHCCALPETFIHYSSCCADFQCACGGKIQNCHIYILPDDPHECAILFDEYVKIDLFKQNDEKRVYYFKVFGLSPNELEQMLPPTSGKLVEVKHVTFGLDSKITLTFSPSCAKKIEEDTIEKVSKAFSGYIYSIQDKSLAEIVVETLTDLRKTLATAESITGGLIASSIVDIGGASNVLYEGAVTYSIPSKCRRLGINPHFIDEHGVVSAQVAKEMALAQLKNADFSISTTGFAGPTAENNLPVGLTYIGIGTNINGEHCVKVFRKVFAGSRNEVRKNVADTALYLLLLAITDEHFFD